MGKWDGTPLPSPAGFQENLSFSGAPFLPPVLTLMSCLGLQDRQRHRVRGRFTTAVWEPHFQKAPWPGSAPGMPNTAPGTVPIRPPRPSAP